MLEVENRNKSNYILKAICFWSMLLLLFSCAELENKQQPNQVVIPIIDSLYEEGTQIYQEDYDKGINLIDSAFHIGYNSGNAKWVGPRKVKVATFDIYIGKVEQGKKKLYQVYNHPSTKTDTSLLLNVLSEIAQYHVYFETIDSAKVYLDKSLQYIDTLNHPTEFAQYLQRSADIKVYKNREKDAISDYLKALDIYDEHATTYLDTSRMVGILMDLGIRLDNTNEMYEGVKYMKRALEYIHPGQAGYAVIASRTSLMFARTGYFASAQQLITKTKKQPEITSSDLYYITIAEGIILFNEEKYHEVLEKFAEAVLVSPKQANESGNRFYRLTLEADALGYLGNHSKMASVVDSLESIAYTDIQKREAILYKAKVQVLKDKSKFSLIGINKIIQSQDSVNQARHQIDLAALDKKYKTSVKDRKIAQQNTEILEKSLKVQRSNTILIFLSLLASALITGVVLFRKNNKKLNVLNKQLLEGKEIIETLNNELNHRVKNNLAFMSSIFQMQIRRTDSEEAKKLLKEMESRLTTMNVTHDLLQYPTSSQSLLLRRYLEDIAKSLENFYSTYEISLEIKQDVEDLPISLKQMMKIGLIINELVSNTVKHTQPKEGSRVVEFSLYGEEVDKYVFTYKDHEGNIPNWKLPNDNRLQSLGTKLVDLMSAQIHGEVQVIDGVVIIRGNLM